MNGIGHASNEIYFYQHVCAKPALTLSFLSALVLAAGAATVGVALAGYIPYDCMYLGTAIIGTGTIILCVALCVLFLKRQKNDESNVISIGIEDGENPSIAEQVTINDLPNETLSQIFGYLGDQDLPRVAAVSKQWNGVLQGSSICQTAFKKLDWQEDSPDCLRVLSWTNRLGSIKQPKVTELGSDKTLYNDSSHRADAFSGNHWIHLGSAPTVGNLPHVVIQVHSVGSKDNQIAISEKTIHTNFPWKIHSAGYYEHLVYMSFYLHHTNDIFIWDLKTNAYEEWKDVHVRPHNLDPSKRHFIECICVTKNRILTCDGYTVRLWDKNNRTLIAEYKQNYSSYLFKSGTWDDDQLESLLSFLGNSKTEDFEFIYKDRLIYLDYDSKIMAYSPRDGRYETIIDSNTSSELKLHCGKVLSEGDTLLMQIEDKIHIYDLKKQKFRHPLKTGQREELTAVLPGIIITHAKEGINAHVNYLDNNIKVYDYR